MEVVGRKKNGRVMRFNSNGVLIRLYVSVLASGLRAKAWNFI